MRELLCRLRYPRPLLTVRSVARELRAYGRALRRPATGSALRFVLFAGGRTGSSVLMDLQDDLLLPERHQATLDRVFDFLGIERAPVTTRYVRTGADRLHLVANLDEIYRALRNTEYASHAADTI
jgi:hypothetical protein